MFGNEHIQQFFLVLGIPTERQTDWERVLRRAYPPTGVRAEVRNPLRILCAVEETVEFIAIARVEKWLRYLADSAMPPIPLNINAQPCGELDSDQEAIESDPAFGTTLRPLGS